MPAFCCVAVLFFDLLFVHVWFVVLHNFAIPSNTPAKFVVEALAEIVVDNLKNIDFNSLALKRYIPNGNQNAGFMR